MTRALRSGGDGPLLFALLLNNVNNNPANVPSNTQNPPKDPSTDSVQLLPSSTILEYKPGYEGSLPTEQKYEVDRSRGYFLRAVGYAAKQDLAEGIHNLANAHETDFDKVLSADRLQFWQRNGYLVIEEALQPEQLFDLRTSLTKVMETLSNVNNAARKEHRLPSDAHRDDGTSIVNPNGRVIATILEGPIDKKLEPLQTIRRIGCGVHRVLPAFRSITFSQQNQKIASLLGFEDPRVTQSIITTKPRGVGAEVVPHQDGCSSFTNPPSAVTFWYALQDTSVRNGCLKVVPGSHRTEPLTMRTRLGTNGCPENVDLPEPVYAKDSAQELDVTGATELPGQPGPRGGDYVYKPLEVKAGTLILLHGNLVHASDANRSETDRPAYNFGVVEGKLPWPQDAYLQPYEGHSEFERLEPKISQA